MKIITILGSTGSIGTQCLDIISQNRDKYTINYLTTNKNIALLEQQCKAFVPKGVVISDEISYKKFSKKTCFKGKILSGESGLVEAAIDSKNELVMVALVGFAGVKPTLEAISHQKNIAIANKEVLVVAGSHIMSTAKKNKIKIIPVDSEHSAIFQCLQGEKIAKVNKIILTASGGAFLKYKPKELLNVKAVQSLLHPTWNMGAKVTVDSATMMNKGFEVIEAHWLFGIAPEKIEVIIHKESIIHSLIEFIDGSVKAQLSVPDMRIPIAYSLSYPNRCKNTSVPLDLSLIKQLNFILVPPYKKNTLNKYECLYIAYQCLTKGGNSPAILNAANEVAVAKYLREEIKFFDIPKLIYQALDTIHFIEKPTIEEIFQTDNEVRNYLLKNN